MPDTPDTARLRESLNSALRFAASRSAITAEQERAIRERFDRIEALEAGLRDVMNPLGKLQREAEAQGRRLSGQAYEIANSLSYVQGIARALVEGEKGNG